MKNSLFRMRSVAVGAIVSSLVAALPAWAVAPFQLRDIRLEGLQRVEPGTVFASLPFRVGDQYSDDKGTAAIRALFGLGLFSDVRLQVNGDELVVIVEERPTVAEVGFTGVKEFDAEVLKKALRDIGLADGRPFDRALADRAEQELKRQYLTRSLYGAQVTATATPIERNRVNVNFNVVEGDIAKIKEIRIVGNQAFSDSQLRGLFDLDTGGWLSWYTKSDRYSRTKLNADLETLRSYYLSRGYLEFRIDSTQVAIAPDKDAMSITVNVTEGKRYVVSSIQLEGDYLGKQEEFKSLVAIKAGQPYNAEDVAQTTKAFTEYFGGFGYAFARVEAKPQIDRVSNQVSLVLSAQPSRRAYVRRISVEGNNRTRDEVIRREFRQLESAWYDSDRIKLSRDRVDRLGFFTQVAVDTVEVPDAPDQVDLVVSVMEKPTGNLTLGAGFSQAEKLSLIAGIQQENLFGSGNYLGLNVNTSKYNRQLSLTTTDPYFTPEGISRTVDLYYRTSQPLDTQEGNYKLTTPGMAVRFGVPFSETDTVYFGAGIEQTKIEPGNGMPLAYNDYIANFGDSPTSVPLTVGWGRDTRDSALVPSTGRLQRVNGELGIAGDTRYAKANYQFQQYIPLNKKFTLAFNAEAGWGQGLSGKPFPLFKNFYGGGLGSVRGFEQGTLGGKSSIVGGTTMANIGGTRKMVLNTEVIAPFPGAGNDRTLRMYGFFDIGNIYAEDEKVDFANLRASTGIGISWISPIGPLRIAYARPVRKQDDDKTQSIQFQIGTSF